MAIGRLDRRIVLLGLIALIVLANLLAALAPNFGCCWRRGSWSG
ncbi:hypothetical protein ACIBG8_35260 [Nonomuraea sp. NPDC050556]